MGPESTLEFFSESFIRFFLNCPWWQVLKVGSNGTFFSPKNAKIQKFYQLCSFDFSKFYVMTGIQNKVKLTVRWFFRTTLILLKTPLFGHFRVQNQWKSYKYLFGAVRTKKGNSEVRKFKWNILLSTMCQY